MIRFVPSSGHTKLGYVEIYSLVQPKALGSTPYLVAYVTILIDFIPSVFYICSFIHFSKYMSHLTLQPISQQHMFNTHFLLYSLNHFPLMDVDIKNYNYKCFPLSLCVQRTKSFATEFM